MLGVRIQCIVRRRRTDERPWRRFTLAGELQQLQRNQQRSPNDALPSSLDMLCNVVAPAMLSSCRTIMQEQTATERS